MLRFRLSESGCCMYQLDTSSIPSGFTCTSRMTQSLRNRIVSGSVRVRSWYDVSMSWWAPNTSVACRPPSIQTTALPSRASARASLESRAWPNARRRAISL